jgi:aminopeptidase N
LLLDAAMLDGNALDLATLVRDDAGLELELAGDSAVLETVVRIAPEANTALEGLYRSGGFLLTQCEAEGFRHITYFPDRPDVLARYTVTLAGDRERFPVLLANGNPDGAGTLPHGRHWGALARSVPEGQLSLCHRGRTGSHCSRTTSAPPTDATWRCACGPTEGAIPRCAHAMECIKRAMAWDEASYGRSLRPRRVQRRRDADFNMGRDGEQGPQHLQRQVHLADAETATDDDFATIEGVIAHEYFHNWTGNRITCRDWFQLSLKEGLTVFRDQEFSARHALAGAQAHRGRAHLRACSSPRTPARSRIRAPDSYLEINNFYTGHGVREGRRSRAHAATVLGPEGFRTRHRPVLPAPRRPGRDDRGLPRGARRRDGHRPVAVRALVRAGRHAASCVPKAAGIATRGATCSRCRNTRQQRPARPRRPPCRFPCASCSTHRTASALLLRAWPASRPDAAREQRVLVCWNGNAQLRVRGPAVPRPFPRCVPRPSRARSSSNREVAASELRFLARHDRDAFNRCGIDPEARRQHTVLAGHARMRPMHRAATGSRHCCRRSPRCSPDPASDPGSRWP